MLKDCTVDCLKSTVVVSKRQTSKQCAQQIIDPTVRHLLNHAAALKQVTEVCYRKAKTEGQRSKMVDTWGESIKTHFIPSTGVALTSQQTSVTCVSVIREEHGVSVLKRGGQCAFKTLMFGRRNQWFLMCSVLLKGHRSTPTSPALFLPLSCFMFQCSLPAKTKSWRIS